MVGIEANKAYEVFPKTCPISFISSQPIRSALVKSYTTVSSSAEVAPYARSGDIRLFVILSVTTLNVSSTEDIRMAGPMRIVHRDGFSIFRHIITIATSSTRTICWRPCGISTGRLYRKKAVHHRIVSPVENVEESVNHQMTNYYKRLAAINENEMRGSACGIIRCPCLPKTIINGEAKVLTCIKAHPQVASSRKR